MYKKLSALAIALAVTVLSLSATVSAAAAPTNKLTPFVKCVSVSGGEDGGPVWFWAFFGYTNSGSSTVKVAPGTNNVVTTSFNTTYPSPTSFDPGIHDNAFYVISNNYVSWKLGDKTVTATPESQPCQ